MSFSRTLRMTLCLLTAAVVSSVGTYYYLRSFAVISPLGKMSLPFLPEPLPLNDYTLENLSAQDIKPAILTIDAIMEETSTYTVYLFSVTVDGQKVTGQMHVPKIPPPPGGFPIIVMNRGYIDPTVYKTGMGTKPAAAYFASKGYVTLAPDFLGFGGSDREDSDTMAARVKKPLTIMTILHSLDSLNSFTKADITRVGMWGHSNGGQISLTVLAIMSHSPHWHQSLPTTLWAPVTAAFPYNILYYTDDFDDVGKKLRQTLYNFELKYDTDQFSFHRYLDWISSPVQLHQGTADDQVPTVWSDRLAKALQAKDKLVTYYTYAGADHNVKPNWNQVVGRDLDFFADNL